MNKKDVIIIGAGLTGLTLAFYLKKKGKKVLVIEKEAVAGGSIRTFRENGFIFESGPNTGTLSNPEIIELFEELDGCRLQTARKEANRRLILKNNRLHALPAGMISGMATPLFSWKDKFNLLLEPFRKKGTDPDESIASLTARRLGKSFLDYAVDPFISGIYAGDPNTIITRYALPKLYALENNYGSFIRGAIRKAKEPKTERDKKVTKKIFSVEGGLESLIQALTESIGPENILLNNASVTVSGAAHNWTVKTDQDEYTAPYIVSTVGPYVLPAIFPFAPETLLSRIDNLRYARIIQVSVGLSVFPGMDHNAFGVLIPAAEKRKILGVLYPSSCFDGRCPEGKVVLSVFLGGIRHPELFDLNDKEIRTLVLDELKNLYRLPELTPDYIHIFRHAHAIPQYEKNTGERLQAIEKFERHYPGIILAGNLRNGIGMADRVRQAVHIARSIP